MVIQLEKLGDFVARAAAIRRVRKLQPTGGIWVLATRSFRRPIRAKAAVPMLLPGTSSSGGGSAATMSSAF